MLKSNNLIAIVSANIKISWMLVYIKELGELITTMVSFSVHSWCEAMLALSSLRPMVRSLLFSLRISKELVQSLHCLKKLWVLLHAREAATELLLTVCGLQWTAFCLLCKFKIWCFFNLFSDAHKPQTVSITMHQSVPRKKVKNKTGSVECEIMVL